MQGEMTIDLVMGALGALIGAALILRSAQFAEYMKEGDDRYREHPWLQVFEPTTGPLATDNGRIVAFRAYVVVAGAGFVLISAMLVARATLGL